MAVVEPKRAAQEKIRRMSGTGGMRIVIVADLRKVSVEFAPVAGERASLSFCLHKNIAGLFATD
jgi:hypothetical protein